MEGQEFVTINPDTLNDPNIWSYRDLQKVSKAVGIKANGKRDELVVKLQTWHRTRNENKSVVEDSHSDNIDMNVVGNNFAILGVNVKASTNSKKRKVKSTRKSIVGIGGQHDMGTISPTFLRPLRPEPATPGKSCLKSCATRLDDLAEDGNNGGNPGAAASKRLANICFSPFNGVRVIAHRDEMLTPEDEYYDTYY